jgi:hypothetical protein
MAEEEAEPTATIVRPVWVDVFSLQVTKLPRDQFGHGFKPGTNENTIAWLAGSGTALDLRFKLDRPVGRFQEQASRLVRFADDKGGDLTKSPGGQEVNTLFPDNKPIVVKLGPGASEGEAILRGYGTPAPGATRLKVHADLVFLTVSEERIAMRKGLETTPGGSATIGPLRIHFKGYDLRLMSWGDGSGAPTTGRNLVIAGTDNDGLLHIRIFDASGDLVTDTDETKLDATQAGAISTLKQKLPSLLPPRVLTLAEKAKLVGEATSIVGQTNPLAVPPLPPGAMRFGPFGRRLPPPADEPGKMRLALGYERFEKPIKSLACLDPQGELLASMEGGSLNRALGGTVFFTIPEIPRITLRVVYFEKSEIITVPIRLETGVGF